MSVKPIALYLPQYHPIPENDEWWGEGFMEWTNVRKAAPRFHGHYQPHVPGDLGYYDLRQMEVMVAQAALAKAYGVYGFCYYHYWFNGKLLLQHPLEQMLALGKPDMPFCLCWANENWSRRWDGREQDLLIEQQYSLEDDREHIRYLLPFFRDDRYIKIDGKPVYVMYRPELHPQIKAAADLWQEEVRQAGFDGLYLVSVENFTKWVNPATYGFDAAMEFAPDFPSHGPKYLKRYPIKYLINKWLHSLKLHKSGFFDNRVYSYDTLVDNTLNKPPADYKQFRSVCPSWDNSARRQVDATIFHGSTPLKFKSWVQEIAAYTATRFEGDEQLFFINAWNEWGEGCHLEPDQRFGLDYLQALKEGVSKK